MNEIELMQHHRAQRQKALRRMSGDLVRLISPRPRHLAWLGTQRDLVEMVHLVWRQHTVADRQGLAYSQNGLARKAFAAVGLAPPRNISHIVQALSQRIDPRRSMLQRYIELDGEPDILAHFVAGGV